MHKGILITAISASLLTLSACSSEPEAEQKAEAQKTIIAAVAEKASQTAEQAAATAKAAVEESKAAATAVVGAVTTTAGNATTAVAGMAATAGAAVTAAVPALKDESGNTVITQTLIDAKTQQSRAAVKAFGGALKTELVTAMKAGGPMNAISVCNDKAPEIAKHVSTEKELNISRVSLKNRAPKGEPLDWQRKVLEEFETRKTAGEDPMKLEFSEVVEMDGKHTLRYMKAIPAGKEVCMACHGSEIKEGVQTKLNELYPNDKATGYKLGDLRGAFVVTQEM